MLWEFCWGSHVARNTNLPQNTKICCISYLITGQARLAEVGKYTPNIRQKGVASLDPVVSRLGINIQMEKPAILGRGRC